MERRPDRAWSASQVFAAAGRDEAERAEARGRAGRACCQIWRVKSAIEVLPLVPVTAATMRGWRRDRSAPPSGPGGGADWHRRPARCRAATGVPAARPARRRRRLRDRLGDEARGRRPWLPGKAANRKPGSTLRESAVRPRIVRIAAGAVTVDGACAPSMGSVSQQASLSRIAVTLTCVSSAFCASGESSATGGMPSIGAMRCTMRLDRRRRDPAAGGKAVGMGVRRAARRP